MNGKYVHTIYYCQSWKKFAKLAKVVMDSWNKLVLSRPFFKWRVSLVAAAFVFFSNLCGFGQLK